MTENWLIEKAKNAGDASKAEAWLLVAKTMPAGGSFDLSMATYEIHCSKKSISEAASSLQKLYIKFSREERFWTEIEKFAMALECSTDLKDDSLRFRRTLFQSLLPDLQQTLLIDLGDRTKELEKKSRIYAVLVDLFPAAIAAFGVEFVTILRELRSATDEAVLHENKYWQILTLKVIPALLNCEDLPLPSSEWLCMLQESLLYHSSLIGSNSKNQSSDQSHQTDRLMATLRKVGNRCDWQIAKQMESTKIERLRSAVKLLKDSKNKEELAFASAVVLLCLVVEYRRKFTGQDLFLLVIPPVLATSSDRLLDTSNSEESVIISPARKRKRVPSSTHQKPKFVNLRPTEVDESQLQQIADCAINCFGLIHSTEKAVQSLRELLHRSSWDGIWALLADVFLYREQYLQGTYLLDETAADSTSALARSQRFSNALALNHLSNAFTYAVEAVAASNATPDQSILDTIGDAKSIIAYASPSAVYGATVRLIINALGAKLLSLQALASDQLIGHVIVLTQADWSKYRWLFKTCVDTILEKGSFSYANFFNYVRNLHILEEIAYLNAVHEKLPLNITDNEAVRKTGLSTRNTTKGAKEEIRQLLEIQVSNYSPSAVQTELRRFLIEQKDSMATYL